MATPFKLKSGNASAFKNLGSSPAKQRVSDLPKDFNRIGSSASTTPGYKPTLPKNFNVKGSKVSTTPNYSTTSKAKTQNFRNEAKKQGKKGIIKKVIGKAASRLIPGIGWGLLAYDAGKWVYKNRKDLKKHAKIVKEKRMKNPSDHGRPKY